MLRATILSSAPLPLPSASGIELVGETAYVVSDDAPFLYRFRAADLTPHEPVRLFETAHFSSGRIPKALKPDLEAMAYLPPLPHAPGTLLLVGSGASAAREGGFWVDMASDSDHNSDNARNLTVFPVSLAVLYQSLRQYLPAGQPLNIEAMAATPEYLWLFQRPVGTTVGRLGFRVRMEEAYDAIRPPHRVPPSLRPRPYAVPEIDGYPGGLSGATFFEDRLFVTASVEKTHDPVVDGEVLGSFIGLLDPKKLLVGQFAQLAWADGRAFREKVEGVAVRRRTAAGYELLLVTDDDQGGSTVLVVEVAEG